MPNMHADHISTTKDKCSMGSPMMQICRYNLMCERFVTLAVGLIFGALLVEIFR